MTNHPWMGLAKSASAVGLARAREVSERFSRPRRSRGARFAKKAGMTETPTRSAYRPGSTMKGAIAMSIPFDWWARAATMAVVVCGLASMQTGGVLLAQEEEAEAQRNDRRGERADAGRADAEQTDAQRRDAERRDADARDRSDQRREGEAPERRFEDEARGETADAYRQTDRQADRRFDRQFDRRQSQFDERDRASTFDERRASRNRSPVELGVYVRAVEDGVQVVDVDPNGPAAKAGVRRGDYLASVDGQRIDEPREVSQIVSQLRQGEQVDLVVWRNGERLRAWATLAATRDGDFRPSGAGEVRRDTGWLGVALMTEPARGEDASDKESDKKADDEKADSEKKDKDKAAEIMLVYPTSPAAVAGLRAGDKIVSVDDREFASAQEMTEYIQNKKPGEEVALSVKSADEDEPQDVKVKLASRSDYIVDEDGRAGTDDNPLYSIPEYMMRMEHERRMAECSKRMEELLLETLREVRELRSEVESLKKEKSESE